MSNDRLRLRLLDIVLAIEKIEKIVATIDFDAFEANFERQRVLE